MATFYRDYNEAIVNHIKDFLESENQGKSKREFIVKLDGEQLFPKTSNLAMFDSYKSFLGPTSRQVTFIIYKGASQHNDKYVLSYTDPDAAKQTTLDGPPVSVEDEVATRLAAIQTGQELSDLRKDNAKLKRKLKKRNKYIGQLEESILEMQTARYKLGKLDLGELSSIALEGMVRRNPHWLKGLPMGSALAGVIEADNERLAEGEAQEVKALPEATFERDETEGGSDPLAGLTPEQLFDLNTGGAIRRSFPTEEEHRSAISILKMLSHRKDLLPMIADMLKAEMPAKQN